jgi:hypothetical protein
VQVFDGNGKYETQWNNLHRPCGLFMPPGKCPVWGEVSWTNWPQTFRDKPRPDNLRSLRKFRKVV